MCFDIGIVTCGPNESLIISGVGYGNKPSTIVGGRAFFFPGLQKVQRLPLSALTLVVESPRVYTSRGVAISVKGVAQVRERRQMDVCVCVCEWKKQQVTVPNSICWETDWVQAVRDFSLSLPSQGRREGE